ncbi:MAG: hypothetical protein MJA82_17440 [Clostridia bacterium]|nr:hypothetical protein [Clostridia bacterium]
MDNVNKISSSTCTSINSHLSFKSTQSDTICLYFGDNKINCLPSSEHSVDIDKSLEISGVHIQVDGQLSRGIVNDTACFNGKVWVKTDIGCMGEDVNICSNSPEK